MTSPWRNPLLLYALALTGAVAVWGIADAQGPTFGALPFVFVVLLMVVSFLKALKAEAAP